MLVPRELAARLYAMMEQGAMVGEPVGMTAGVIAAGAARAAVGFGAGPVDFESLLPHAVPADANGANGDAAAGAGVEVGTRSGPRGPTGSLKTLWDQTIAEAQAAKDADAKERADRDAKTRKEPPRRPVNIPDKVIVEEYRPSLRERLSVLRDYLRTDVTLSDVLPAPGSGSACGRSARPSSASSHPP